jgi:hypothetical protein
MLAEPKTKRSAAAAAALGAAVGLPGAPAAMGPGFRGLEGLGLGAHMGLHHAALLAQQVRPRGLRAALGPAAGGSCS